MALTDRAKTLLLGAIGDQPSTMEIIQLLELAGTGNMTGPGLSTLNALPRFADATGALLKNSGVIVDNSNNVSGIGTLNAGATTVTSLSLTNGILTSPAATNLLLQAAGVTGISVNFSTLASTFSGNILFGTDNTFTIGTSTSGRASKGYAAQQWNTGDIATFAGSFPIASSTVKSFYVGANGEASFNAEAFGGPAVLRLRYANGTNAAPTGVLSGHTMGTVLLQGWDGVSAYGSGAAFTAVATQNWSATARGTIAGIQTIKQGESVRTDRMYFGEGAFVSIAPNNNFYSYTDGSSNIGQSTDNRFGKAYIKLLSSVGSVGTSASSWPVLHPTFPTQYVSASGAENPSFVTESYSTGSAPRFISKRARGTNTAPTSVLTNDNLGAITFDGYDSTAFTEAATEIRTGAAEDFTATNHGTALSIRTTKIGAAEVPANRFTIDGNGDARIAEQLWLDSPAANYLANIFLNEDQAGQIGGGAEPTGDFPVSDGYGRPFSVNVQSGFNAGGGGSPGLLQLLYSGGSPGSETIPVDTDGLGAIVFAGFNGPSYTNAARITSVASENWVQDTANGTAIEFYVSQNGTFNTPLLALTLENNGTVAAPGNVRVTGNLGVGNSAAATLPGTVTNKIEIFDEAGVSLGFIAVYDTIT